ncbi:ArdC family protein [Carboxylicivirga sp. RSCT41]|uniref:ArdC family protein n=1 Tax=Carboxylicivirga agarovorans TaxID=3417570 RepID=UPI003D3498ED
MNNFDIYETVTNLIIDRLEKGVIPWALPWKTSDAIPRNLISKKPYRGFNFWYLLSFEFERPYFLTFNQVKQLGASIKKGAKSFIVIFWKILEVKKDNEIEEIPILRYYRVFHIDDIEGISEKKIPTDESFVHDFETIESCEELIKNWNDAPVIKHGNKKACYIPLKDEIHMPDAKHFFKNEEYYSTLYHEIVHSTGHSKRQNRHQRFSNLKFGSKDYSQDYPNKNLILN